MGVEETIHRDIQNRIEQDVFGTLTNFTQTPELTLGDVKKAVDEINKIRTMYYRVSDYALKTNDENERIVYFFEHTEEFVLHPDNLPDFVKKLECAGYAVRDVKTLSREEQIQRTREFLEASLTNMLVGAKQ